MDWAKSWSKFIKAFIEQEGYKTVISGLEATAKIALFGFIIGIVLGVIIAVVKLSGERSKVGKVFAGICNVYVTFFRGTPIIVQLLLSYYLLFPYILQIKVDNILVAIITFGLNSGAYVSEIIRSGILAVDIGQTEAGRSLGLSYPVTMLRVVLPQAFKNSLPTLGNELIALVKDTSVVSFIAVTDLTNAFKLLGSSSYDYIIPYLMLALTYLIIVLLLTLIIRLVERRLRKSDRR